MSVVSVTNEINAQIIQQVPNIVTLVHAAEETDVSGIEKGIGVVQVISAAIGSSGVPDQEKAIANSVNLIFQLLKALGVGSFKKKATAPAAA